MSTHEETMSKTSKLEYPPHLEWMLKRALEDPENFCGEVACAFVVLKSGYEPNDVLKQTLRNSYRRNEKSCGKP